MSDDLVHEASVRDLVFAISDRYETTSTGLTAVTSDRAAKVERCRLHVALLRTASVARCIAHRVCCTLHRAWCRSHLSFLHRPPCRLHVASRTLSFASCVVAHSVCCTLHRPPCRLHLSFLHRPPCRLHVALLCTRWNAVRSDRRPAISSVSISTDSQLPQKRAERRNTGRCNMLQQISAESQLLSAYNTRTRTHAIAVPFTASSVPAHSAVADTSRRQPSPDPHAVGTRSNAPDCAAQRVPARPILDELRILGVPQCLQRLV